MQIKQNKRKQLFFLRKLLRYLDESVPKNLSFDFVRGRDKTVTCNGFVFKIHNNDHLPAHVHVEKGGIKSLFIIEEDTDKPDLTYFSPNVNTWIRHIIKWYKPQFLKKWKIQNPELAKPRPGIASTKHRKRTRRKDSMGVMIAKLQRHLVRIKLLLRKISRYK